VRNRSCSSYLAPIVFSNSQRVMCNVYVKSQRLTISQQLDYQTPNDKLIYSQHFQHPMLTIICEKCYNTFKAYPNEIKRGRAQFCSNNCKKTYNYKLKTKRVCPICHREFWTYNSDRIYCSVECTESTIISISTSVDPK